ncbi:hypothetical protein KIF59_05960 [Enterobacter cloacae subsp. cloacae]|nr:hypothetical protein [Enterobacter cloacae subsp. cloacae]
MSTIIMGFMQLHPAGFSPGIWQAEGVRKRHQRRNTPLRSSQPLVMNSKPKRGVY